MIFLFVFLSKTRKYRPRPSHAKNQTRSNLSSLKFVSSFLLDNYEVGCSIELLLCSSKVLKVVQCLYKDHHSRRTIIMGIYVI